MLIERLVDGIQRPMAVVWLTYFAFLEAAKFRCFTDSSVHS